MDEMASLRRQVRLLQIGLLTLTAVAVMAASSERSDVLTTHGLVIVDREGRQRIVLGSPTPPVAGRQAALATSSIVFRSTEGKDRLILGEEPNPIVAGKIRPRIASGWGLLWFNPAGDERGGVSYLDSGRSVVSLDRAAGEGVYMTVNEQSGFAGLVANYESSRPEEHAEAVRIGTLGAKAFAQAANRDGTPARAIFAGGGGQPRLTDVVQK
ncbi:MAG: hypothetical protein M3Y41_18590 [Pseudomonadota bacterium]|nr:hypothetical protein [Pseudomonadota bacterium]